MDLGLTYPSLQNGLLIGIAFMRLLLIPDFSLMLSETENPSSTFKISLVSDRIFGWSLDFGVFLSLNIVNQNLHFKR